MSKPAFAPENLLREGADPAAIHMVGNTMIDTLVAFDERINGDPVLEELGLGAGGHVLMTIHRPSTVDDPVQLRRLVDLIAFVANRYPVVFPVHPRTVQQLGAAGLLEGLDAIPGLHRCDPLDYFSFQRLVSTSTFVLTDSGGIQEETTYRGIPCLTLRSNTERPVTITEGTNELLSFDLAEEAAAMDRIAGGTFKKGRIPAQWDGHATERVFQALMGSL